MKFIKPYKIFREEYINSLNSDKYTILDENIQLADKKYFKTKILNDEEKKEIISITNSDYTTNVITEMYIQIKNLYEFAYKKNELIKELILIHKQLLEYNKNLFPVKNFDFYNTENSNIFEIFRFRSKILEIFKKLPSIAIRNLKNEIRKERTYSELKKYSEDLEYFMNYFSLMDNRPEKSKIEIFKKLFKSGITLDSMISFVEEKTNLIGGHHLDKKEIYDIVNENSYDLSIVYDKNNYMVIKVESQNGIKQLGCNSLWCFTYGEFDKSSRDWYEYSYNNTVYVIIDLSKNYNDEYFMVVLIKPLLNKYKFNEDDDIPDSPLYDMTNYQINDPLGFFKNTIGISTARKLFTFD